MEAYTDEEYKQLLKDLHFPKLDETLLFRGCHVSELQPDVYTDYYGSELFESAYTKAINNKGRHTVDDERICVVAYHKSGLEEYGKLEPTLLNRHFTWSPNDILCEKSVQHTIAFIHFEGVMYIRLSR
jgi:hypothetical protein